MCAIRTVPPASDTSRALRPRAVPVRTLRHASPVPHTVVFFHAHPDDEALLTSGTMAKLAAQGHRVVLVVATAGEAGLAADELTADGGSATDGWPNCEASAAALGVHRLEVLGYADSGLGAGSDGATAGRVTCPGSSTSTSTSPRDGSPRSWCRERASRADHATTPTAATATRTTSRCTAVGAAAAAAGRHPGAAGGDGAAGSAAGRGPRGEPAAAAVPTGGPRALGARLLRLGGDHPLHRRPRPGRAAAGVDAGARQSGDRGQRSPHAGRSSPGSRRRCSAGCSAGSGTGTPGRRHEPVDGKRFTGLFDTL